MTDERKCDWCHEPLGDIAGEYCSARCLQAERAHQFIRDKMPGEKWVRFSVEIPPEMADLLLLAQRRQAGVNWPSCTKAGLTRAALLTLLDEMLPMPEPAVDATAEFVREPLLLIEGGRS